MLLKVVFFFNVKNKILELDLELDMWDKLFIKKKTICNYILEY